MLTIDFLTDYVCPFCLVTKENLRAALKTLHQEAEIIEHPYALTPEGGEATDICDEVLLVGAHINRFAVPFRREILEK